MLLHAFFFCWAIIAFLLVAGSLISLFTRGSLHMPNRSLLDFSGGLEDDQKWADLLRAALAETTTDAEFERSVRRSLAQSGSSDVEMEWGMLTRHLVNYRRAEEWQPLTRILAARFLADLSRRVDKAPDTSQ